MTECNEACYAERNTISPFCAHVALEQTDAGSSLDRTERNGTQKRERNLEGEREREREERKALWTDQPFFRWHMKSITFSLQFDMFESSVLHLPTPFSFVYWVAWLQAQYRRAVSYHDEAILFSIAILS